ncbi:MAG: argininosuccinate lyase [Flavobacteriaceae bacterium]
MKLWDKGIGTDKKVDLFTVGNDRELDLILAKYDVKASGAHAKMLGEIGLLTSSETEELIQALDLIEKEISEGKFTIEDDFEDMHSKIEYLLTDKLGDTGKKIHTARSRNDQVLVAIQLYLKDEIKELKLMTKKLFDLLISSAEEHKNILMPGYTHMQIAMPSSFGLWFSSYAESLVDDIYVLNTASKVVDQNPLGSAAGYGSSFPIDRQFTTDALGFQTQKYNVIAAQMGRGKIEKITAFGMATLAGTLSKLAMDICLYMSQNFNFISFPDEFTTGSSIMPHKKNPDVFELIRAKCNKIQSLPGQITLVVNNLTSGYHRDYQLCKEIIIPGLQEIKACLEMTTSTLSQAAINKSILEDNKYDYLFSVERLNELVQQGVPFRDAYKQVGQEIQEGTYKPIRKINHTHQGSIGNLCLDEIRSKMSEALGDL